MRIVLAPLALLFVVALGAAPPLAALPPAVPPAVPPDVSPAPPAAPAPRRETVRIGAETFRLELAVDEAARDRGLAGRKTIASDGGMLFVFPAARTRRFWMAGCAIDMDILFLDARGRIVAGHRMKAEPPRAAGESEAAYHRRLRLYPSGRSAQFAIEVAAGTLDRLRLRRGDVIELDRARLVDEARRAARRPPPPSPPGPRG